VKIASLPGIREDFQKELKKRAADKGCSIKSILEALIEKFLGKKK